MVGVQAPGDLNPLLTLLPVGRKVSQAHEGTRAPKNISLYTVGGLVQLSSWIDLGLDPDSAAMGSKNLRTLTGVFVPQFPHLKNRSHGTYEAGHHTDRRQHPEGTWV